ncbi:MAG: hypothetical protein HQL58_00690 [Magnetococcales bacterium]|nr:hypothetical protein [Magnetococcales bacterium]
MSRYWFVALYCVALSGAVAAGAEERNYGVDDPFSRRTNQNQRWGWYGDNFHRADPPPPLADRGNQGYGGRARYFRVPEEEVGKRPWGNVPRQYRQPEQSGRYSDHDYRRDDPYDWRYARPTEPFGYDARQRQPGWEEDRYRPRRDDWPDRYDRDGRRLNEPAPERWERYPERFRDW